MRSERVDELLLVKYLLGYLPDAEQVRIEDRALAEPDYRRELEAVEADLIDSYVRSELVAADRRAFELRFLTSPQRRGKVAFAKALAAVTRETESLPSSEPRPAWRALAALIRGSNPAWRFAAALALLVCVSAGLWLVFENASLRSRLSVLEAQRLDLETRDRNLQQELSAARSRVERPATPLIATLVLLPGLSRAQTRVEELMLGPGVQMARIEIQLEDRDDHPKFRGQLHTQSGTEILSWNNLARSRGGAGYVLSLDVPASILASGDYELALQGLPQGQPAQDVGYYYFRVQKR